MNWRQRVSMFGRPACPVGTARRQLLADPRAGVVTKGATPALTPAETRELLDRIDTETLVGLRDRALSAPNIRSSPATRRAGGSFRAPSGAAAPW